MGAAALLVLALGIWIGVRWSASAPSPAGSREQEGAERPSAPIAQTPAPTPVPSTTPPPRPASPPPASPPAPPPANSPPSEDDEVLLPPPPADMPDTRADRYESQDGGEPEIRTILAVGDIRMGVVRDSEIRDQEGLNRVLVRIGGELERRMQSQQPQQRGELAMQKLLDDYQEELGRYMNGEVELRGPGFSIGTEVGPPLPREKWWKPRPQ
ncbi:hypothetical protein CYFUS_004000 [Cystobacter fuscus]|uniref:Uncharacterized protein n=2 Tax=Cystobacter fuscus TaxID=43 RepID=A0A250J3K8_9BACT|nr:hypothetical protein CYFUS_004000 [Cystobacter fuscus]